MDVEFHSKIAMITQNSLVVQTYALLLEFLSPVMHRTYVTLGAEEGIPYHERLIQAFCAHDAVSAKNVMGAHGTKPGGINFWHSKKGLNHEDYKRRYFPPAPCR